MNLNLRNVEEDDHTHKNNAINIINTNQKHRYFPNISTLNFRITSLHEMFDDFDNVF